MDQTVVVYTSPTCHFCHQVKEFLKEKNIEFTEKDVLSDDAAREEAMQKSGQVGVPVVLINEEVIVGFDQPAMEKALGLTAN